MSRPKSNTINPKSKDPSVFDKILTKNIRKNLNFAPIMNICLETVFLILGNIYFFKTSTLVSDADL